MISKYYTDTNLSIALFLSASAWGLFWWPLRTIENIGISGSWSVVFFNACPLIVLCPLLLFNFKNLKGVLIPTAFTSFTIGLAFTFYSNGLVETTVVRATLIYYLTPIWSTLIGVVWLSEILTKARVLAIIIAFAGLYLLLSDGNISGHPINIGDLYSFLAGIFWAIGVSSLKRWSNIPIMPLATFIFISTTFFSTLFAWLFFYDFLPHLDLIKKAFPTAAFWSIIIMLPSFCIIFRVSQFLFPGRVGILTMSEVIVAIISASILIGLFCSHVKSNHILVPLMIKNALYDV